MRFFLIDRVTKIEINHTIEGIKAWSLDNPIFLDHFPGVPIVPGVLLTESMAQLLGLLIEKSYYDQFGTKSKVYPILSIIQKAKFRNLVRPGDQTRLKAELTTIDKQRAVGKVKVHVDGELAAESTLSFFLGTSEDFPENTFMKRRDEYLHILFKDIEL